MTDDEQTAGSLKYIPPPLAFVPVSGGFAVFRAYGAARDLIGIYPPTAIPGLLHSEYHTATSRRAERKRVEAARHLPPDLDLSGLLSLTALNIPLDIPRRPVYT